MNAFAAAMAERVAEAQTSLQQARRSGDDYLASIRLGELESLAWLARDHDLHVPGLSADEPTEPVVDLRLPSEADASYQSRR